MPITNQLTDQEKRDWADLFKKADEGDKVAKKDVEDITCVKEMMQLMYVPAVWADGDEPNEEDSKEEEDEENEEKKAKKSLNHCSTLILWESRIVQQANIQQTLDL